jgi:hypothetical protein
MFTPQEKVKIQSGFDRGLPDTLIAKRLRLKHMAVFKFRLECGITQETILKNRYDTWVRLLEDGVDVEDVALRYDIRAQSVRVALWRTRQFSFVEIKRRQRAEAEDGRAARLQVNVINW